MVAPRAALFCRSFLSFSETFIYDELQNHDRWEVDVFCRVRENEDRFPFPRVYTPAGRVADLLYRATMYSPDIERHLRAGDHRLIHAHFGNTAIYAQVFARRLRLPFVVTFHGFDVAALISPLKLDLWLLRYRVLVRSVLARADVILCPSVELQDILARVSGRPAATRLYRLGIDLTRFRPTLPNHTTPTAVMIGRFVEKKGHLDGIEAFAQAIKGGGDARLVIVGAGPLEAAYRERIAALGIATRVELVGVLSATEIAALLRTSDVLLAPSRVARDGDRESGVIVVKEASATALPVLGTRHGGIPEIIDDGITGYLVDEGDIAALGNRLRELFGDSALRTSLGLEGRAKMEREYDVRARVSELERLYDDLVPGMR